VRVRLAAVLVATCAIGGCGGGGSNGPSAQTPDGPTPPPGGSLVVFTGGATAAVEIADSREEQLRGLMGRTKLGSDEGMLFRFGAPQRIGFWMKDTLIPLSIAYMKRTDGHFEVVAIREMTPCKADPCTIYTPGADYDAALEMNEGWFHGHGIDVGDTADERSAG
jgi:uncharacterized membrane protein (UPF0127 family)